MSVFCLQLESEATHRAVTIANRVRVHHTTACIYYSVYIPDYFLLLWFQAHCPIYLVNVSSMSAGDMVAAAKMQGEF